MARLVPCTRLAVEVGNAIKAPRRLTQDYNTFVLLLFLPSLVAFPGNRYIAHAYKYD